MVCFPVKEEMEDPSKYTEANPVTLESTRQARKDGTTPQWDLTDWQRLSGYQPIQKPPRGGNV